MTAGTFGGTVGTSYGSGVRNHMARCMLAYNAGGCAMNAERLRLLQEGRDRAREQNRCAAVARVRIYLEWLKSGRDRKRMPPIPSEADFRAARGQKVSPLADASAPKRRHARGVAVTGISARPAPRVAPPARGAITSERATNPTQAGVEPEKDCKEVSGLRGEAVEANGARSETYLKHMYLLPEGSADGERERA